MNAQTAKPPTRREIDAQKLSERSREMWGGERDLYLNRPMTRFIERVAFLKPMGMDEPLQGREVMSRNSGVLLDYEI